MRVQGKYVEEFFKWSMRDPVNYFEPRELDFFCKNVNGEHCIFPQDVRSKSYQIVSERKMNIIKGQKNTTSTIIFPFSIKKSKKYCSTNRIFLFGSPLH